MVGEVIKCRSRVSQACYHGRATGEVYEMPSGMADDGTWNGSSVICDACYIAIGQPLRGTPLFRRGFDPIFYPQRTGGPAGGGER